jgi:hypothetical protein
VVVLLLGGILGQRQAVEVSPRHQEELRQAVHMQVGAADVGPGDLDDGVTRLSDARFRYI